MVAGPWVAVLTSHYGKLTPSTAGSANHANMSPTAYGNDPLWNPGLVADFIADPRLRARLVAAGGRRHFLHQLKVIAYQPQQLHQLRGPVARVGRGLRGGPQRQSASPIGTGRFQRRFPGLWWCVITVLLYCGGYSFINLESRYIVPVITPLLCLGAMLIVPGTAHSTEDRFGWESTRWRRSAWWVIPV